MIWNGKSNNIGQLIADFLILDLVLSSKISE